MKRNLIAEKEMTFLEHLEELRWRIIYSLIGIVIGTIIAWIFIDFLVDVVLLKPAKDSGAISKISDHSDNCFFICKLQLWLELLSAFQTFFINSGNLFLQLFINMKENIFFQLLFFHQFVFCSELHLHIL